MKSKNPFRIGALVDVINENLKGKVIRVDGRQITLESEDGFLYTYLEDELVISREWNSLIKVADNELAREGRVKNTQIKTIKGSVVKEIDLHIHELTNTEAGMTKFDKLSLQLETARKELESAIQKKQQKIIFIHGYGAGILKKELRILLGNYPVAFHDASYTEYGLGATEVLIFQNKK